MRSVPLRMLLAMAFTAVACLAADNSLGSWKLNTAKSKYGPMALPVKSLNITREASDGGVKQTTTGELADGTAVNSSYTAKYDGTEAHVSGNAPYDTIAVKQVNANTLTDERRKTGGSYKVAGRTVVSDGGKTMTVNIKGTDAEGKAFTGSLVFDKQ